MRLLRRAGGVPVFAHPGLSDRDELVPALVAAGLMGIECYYSEHSATQRGAYVDLCRRYDLVATGGSDFHGHNKADVLLGRGRNNVKVPLEWLEALETKWKQKQLLNKGKKSSRKCINPFKMASEA